MSRYFRELSVCACLAVLLLVMAVFAPSFFAPAPMLSRLARDAPTLVCACGIALVLISRQIDISIGSQFAICSVAAGWLAAAHYPFFIVVAGALVLGMGMGAVNGLLIAGLQLPAIVVTLATMAVGREGLRWARQGEFINLPASLQWLGLSQRAGQLSVIAAALAVFALLSLGLQLLSAGRYIYATGSNAEAARLAGLRPRLVTFCVFVFMGLLCGLGALMNLVQSPQVDPKTGTGLELRAIAAAVVGGVAITGGRGNLAGVLVGLLLLTCVNPALTYLHVEAYWEKAIAGLIILSAVVADGFRRNRAPAS